MIFRRFRHDSLDCVSRNCSSCLIVAPVESGAPTKADNTQTGSIELRCLGLFFATSAFYQWANSTKETLSIMKPKQIFISILAVLLVFPFMGLFTQLAAYSGYI